LDRKHRRIYWLAYVLVAAGLLLLGIVWLRLHENWGYDGRGHISLIINVVRLM
jgi:hypothetical protein